MVDRVALLDVLHMLPSSYCSLPPGAVLKIAGLAIENTIDSLPEPYQPRVVIQEATERAGWTEAVANALPKS